MDMHTAFARDLITREDETIPESLHELVVAGKEDHAIDILTREASLDPRHIIIDGRRVFLRIEENTQRIASVKIQPSRSIDKIGHSQLSIPVRASMSSGESGTEGSAPIVRVAVISPHVRYSRCSTANPRADGQLYELSCADLGETFSYERRAIPMPGKKLRTSG